jgi:hypothetical protein
MRVVPNLVAFYVPLLEHPQNPRPLQATLFELGYTPIDVWIQKMDIVGDCGRREFSV